MTENEKLECAIHCMKVQAEVENCEDCKAYNMDNSACRDIAREAIKALEEVQEYRKLGTLAKVEEAIEKNKPKNPDYEGDGYSDGKMVYDTWICPNCGVKYEVDYEEYDYCPDCGQKIDWSVNYEENQPHQEQR